MFATFIYCKVSGLSPWRTEFHPISVRMKFLVHKVALGQGFLRAFRCYHARFTRQMPRARPHVLLLLEGQMAEAWELATKQCFLGNRRELHRKVFPRRSSSV